MSNSFEDPRERRHLKSINEYLEALREHDDVQEVDAPIDLNLELGAGIRYAFENNLPALFFTNITGFPHYRFTGGLAPYSSDPKHRFGRISLAMGLRWDTHPMAIVDRLIAIDYDTDVIPRVVVPDPVGRKLHDTVDLFDIPAPMLHEGDGGDYLNTIGTMIVTTPDGSWTNWHVCRVMRLDAQRLSIWTRPTQQFGMIYEMWKKIGNPIEFALALGPEPAATILSGSRVPHMWTKPRCSVAGSANHWRSAARSPSTTMFRRPRRSSSRDISVSKNVPRKAPSVNSTAI